MATYGLQAGIFFVVGRNADGTPQFSATGGLAKTFATSEEAEAFGLTLVFPAGTDLDHGIWHSLQVVTGRCVIRKKGKFLSATSDDVVWVEGILNARDFGSTDDAQAFIQRRTATWRLRRTDDGRALKDAVVDVVFV